MFFSRVPRVEGVMGEVLDPAVAPVEVKVVYLMKKNKVLYIQTGAPSISGT